MTKVRTDLEGPEVLRRDELSVLHKLWFCLWYHLVNVLASTAEGLARSSEVRLLDDPAMMSRYHHTKLSVTG